MKALNTRAIASSPIFSREKGEIDEIKNYTLKHATIVTSKHATIESPDTDGEIMVAVTFAESEKRYWASGSFADFITDNTDIDKINDTDLNFEPYNVKVTYGGKKTSKNNRKYNSWEISY